MLKNEYWLAKVGVDAVEKGTQNLCEELGKSSSTHTHRQQETARAAEALGAVAAEVDRGGP